jgi:acrylyl-CoA reductase (NADPH)
MAHQGTFKALVVERDGDVAVPESSVRDLSDGSLPDGDVVVDVAYSSLNYKDGLALAGRGNVLRSYPMVPGIDLAGTVAASSDAQCPVGHGVVLTGWGIGENRMGGYSQRNRVPGDWLLTIPPGMTTKSAMAVGTAGLTAMLSALAIHDGDVAPDHGEILVTGASGGVGSLAVLLLSRMGYRVVASSGKPDAADYLRQLGAVEVIGRAELVEPTGKLLGKGRWAGAVDAVGGATLAGVLRCVKTWGVVAQCGVAGGIDLNTTVLPFTLRGVSLVGIHCGETPNYRRRAAWNMIAQYVSESDLDAITQVIGLADVPAKAAEILAGKIRGRVVVDVAAG